MSYITNKIHEFVNEPVYELLTYIHINPLRTVVPYMYHGNKKFDICKQIAVTLSSLA